MKFTIKDFFSKCDQIPSFKRIWSYLLKKSVMENFIYCTVTIPGYCKYLFPEHILYILYIISLNFYYSSMKKVTALKNSLNEYVLFLHF